MKSWLRNAVYAGTFLGLLSAPFPAGAQSAFKPPLDPAQAVPRSKSVWQSLIVPVQASNINQLVELMKSSFAALQNEVEDQTNFLNKLVDAHVGERNVPLHNSPEEARQREGGTGLRSMAQAVLDGTFTTPADMKATLDQVQTAYKLENAFSKKENPTKSQVFVGNAAAQAAVVYSIAEQSYQRANASADRLGTYIEALDKSADIKTSIDLNTRAVIELSQQTNESIRTQAALTSLAAVHFMIIGGEFGANNFADLMKNFNR